MSVWYIKREKYMERCETCGGELEATKAGAIVEVNTTNYGKALAGLAVVLARATRDAVPPSWDVMMIAGLAKGQCRYVSSREFRVVHGYIHIDRDGLPRADRRYRVGRSFEAIPVPVRSAFNDATDNF